MEARILADLDAIVRVVVACNCCGLLQAFVLDNELLGVAEGVVAELKGNGFVGLLPLDFFGLRKHIKLAND